MGFPMSWPRPCRWGWQSSRQRSQAYRSWFATVLTAAIVAQRDAQALAEAIGRLLADPQHRRRLGEAARTTICECFDSSATTQELLRRFRLQMEAGRTSAPLAASRQLQS